MSFQSQIYQKITELELNHKKKQLKNGRKRPLDTPKRMIQRRERERKKGRRRDIEREGEIRETLKL